jgi:hypothetical protein
MLDGVLGRYMETATEDMALDGGLNWDGLVKVVTPLAEARRKMAATEAELQPRSYDRVEVVVVGGLPGEAIWTTEHEDEDGAAVATISGDDNDA